MRSEIGEKTGWTEQAHIRRRNVWAEGTTRAVVLRKEFVWPGEGTEQWPVWMEESD